MSDFGGKLRGARERRGVSLRQIAASTKISVSQLEALERNDVAKLPGGIFSRAFVRSYASEVGLEPGPTIQEFLETFGPGEAEPERSSASFDDLSGGGNRRMLVTLLMIAVVVALAAFLMLRGRFAPTPVTMAVPAADTAPGR